MCNYRYIYYSRCQHPELTLVSFCDRAYERAGLRAPHLRDATEGVGPPLGRTTTATASNSTIPKACRQTAGQERHDAGSSVVEQRAKEQKVPLQQPVQQAGATQQTPPTTWASIARTAAEANSGSVARTASTCATPSTAFSSPAQRLAARLDSAKPADDRDASNMQSSDPFQLVSGDWGNEDSSRSRWVGRGRYRGVGGGRGRGSSMLSTVTEHGRGGSDQTVRAGKPLKGQEGFLETEGTSIDLRSPAEFPLLSPAGAPLSSSLPNRAPSSSTSWAHVARLVSADRPDSSFTSEPTAVSDAGTVSTSPSSFASDILDPVSLVVPALPGMAPPRAPGATLNFRRPLLPPTSANATHQPDSPRRQLPAEWTGGLRLGSEKTTPVVTKQKSLGNLRQSKAAHDGSTVTPKSPTKVVPFELATARRAAAREQKDKASGTNKLVPVVPKTLPTSKAGSKTHSKAASSDTTSTSQYQTAAASPFPSGSSQSFATAHEEPYHALPPPGSPSRIPRLVATVGRSGAPRTSGSEPSPVRPEVRHEAPVSETASEPPADIQRTPSPAAPPMQNITIPDPSLDTAKWEDEARTPTTSEKKGDRAGAIDVASREMTKSDKAISKANTTVADVRHVEHSGSHVHFVEAPETLRNKPGLGIVHNLSGLSSESSEHPNVLSQAGLQGSGYIQPSFQVSSPILSSATHTEALSHFGKISSIERLQPKERSTVDDAEQNDAPSPESINTWPKTSDISVSRATEHESIPPHSKESTYGPVAQTFFTAEMAACSKFPFNKGQSSSSRPDEGSQLSLHSLESTDSSDVSTIKGNAFASPGNPIQTTTSKQISVPPHKRAAWGGNIKAPHPSTGNATIPSRLNARAQEFVPGGTPSGSQFPATASRVTHARPQMPPEWMATQPTNYAPGETLLSNNPIAEASGSTSWKKGRKKKKTLRKLSEEHGDLRERPSDSDMSAYNLHPSWSISGPSSSVGGPYGTVPGRFSTTVGQYGTRLGENWNIPNTGRDMGPGGALRTITNASYGHRPQMVSQPPEEPYLGRGGSGIPTGAIPKGDEAVEKWWHNGWTSTNGGPLTHGAVYDYLRSTDKAREKYPSIFPSHSEEEAGEYPGHGILQPCGNMNMVGAFEALPHYPLLCPRCQPDSHESMQAEGV